jgi:hemerythrin-like domain-containing protein
MASEDGAIWDLYREIHKGMRHALFAVTAQAGRTHETDARAVDALVAEWRDVAFVLRGHHAHEDAFCDVLIAQHAPALRESLEDQHALANDALVALDRAALELRRAALPRVQAFYLELASFTARYLEHLRFEEEQVMPALGRALSNEALAGVTAQIRGSVPPDDMCIFIKYMVPGMNPVERLDMLGGMHRFAPPEIFELFRGAAQRALPAQDYQVIASRLGIA